MKNEIKLRKWVLYIVIIVLIGSSGTLAYNYYKNRPEKKNPFEELTNMIKDNTDNFEVDKKISVSSFNIYFSHAEGTKSKFLLDSIIDDIVTSNKKNPELLITLVYNDVTTTDTVKIKEVKKSLSDNHKYEVSVDYDEKGYVNKITIEDLQDDKVNNNSNVNNDKKAPSNNVNIEDIENQNKVSSFNFFFKSGLMNGFFVKSQIDRVSESNNENSDHQISVSFQNVSYITSNELKNLKSKLSDWTDYNITLEKDSKGYINKMIIE